jgi:phage tail tape-measure protein
LTQEKLSKREKAADLLRSVVSTGTTIGFYIAGGSVGAKIGITAGPIGVLVGAFCGALVGGIMSGKFNRTLERSPLKLNVCIGDPLSI